MEELSIVKHILYRDYFTDPEWVDNIDQHWSDTERDLVHTVVGFHIDIYHVQDEYYKLTKKAINYYKAERLAYTVVHDWLSTTVYKEVNGRVFTYMSWFVEPGEE